MRQRTPTRCEHGEGPSRTPAGQTPHEDPSHALWTRALLRGNPRPGRYVGPGPGRRPRGQTRVLRVERDTFGAFRSLTLFLMPDYRSCRTRCIVTASTSAPNYPLARNYATRKSASMEPSAPVARQ